MAQSNGDVATLVITNESGGPISMHYNDYFNHLRRQPIVKERRTGLPDTVKINLEKPTEVVFTTSDNRDYPVYVMPNDLINVHYSFNKIQKFTFSGTYLHELNFLSFMSIKGYGISQPDLTNLFWTEKLDVAVVIEEYERLYNERLKILKNYSDSLSLNKKYHDVYLYQIKLMYLIDMMQPFYRVSDKTRLPENYLKTLDSFKEWINTSDDIIYSQWYPFAIRSYHMYLNRSIDDPNDFFRKSYFSAREIYNEKVANLLQFNILHDNREKPCNFYEECLADFRTNCLIEAYTKHLESEFKSVKQAKDSLVQAKTFTDEVLIGIDEKKTSWGDVLKNGQGKILYIDIWASWCAPCRGEMPSSIKLQNELSKELYSFVYISIDTDKHKWTKAIKALKLDNPSSKHFLLNPNSNLARFITSNSVPKYVLIGDKSQVITLDANRPSDPTLKEILSDLTKNK
ncbi:TlpA family protein disulfide reductase [Rudanella lutea]|uniref:TlpA family protein disulfide reductase n=1 Tax=Rudanella lutea TaxID=451374 RepID=UPI00146F1040|nr:TlpA disulfide reductase family protein [Rudanella lutea]